MKIEYRLKKNPTNEECCPQYRDIKSLLGIKMKGEWLNIMMDNQNGLYKVFKEGSPHEYDERYYSPMLANMLILGHQERLSSEEKYDYITL